jgi:HTH-type transcriptional regulator / antitoxin HipB
MNIEAIIKSKTLDELLDNKYGKIGNEKRDNFEEKAQYFVISEMLKEASSTMVPPSLRSQATFTC